MPKPTHKSQAQVDSPHKWIKHNNRFINNVNGSQFLPIPNIRKHNFLNSTDIEGYLQDINMEGYLQYMTLV